MDKSAEQPMKMPQSFPINQPNNVMNNNYGQPIRQNMPNYINPSQPIMYNQVQPQPQIVNMVNTQFGTQPVSLTCQFCQTPVTTVVEKSFSICSCLLCWCTGFVFWVCVQCCRKKEINCCDAKHKCPNCGQYLGSYTSC